MNIEQILAELAEIRAMFTAKEIDPHNMSFDIHEAKFLFYASWKDDGSEGNVFESGKNAETVFTNARAKVAAIKTADERAIEEAIAATAKALEALDRAGLAAKPDPALAAFAADMRRAIEEYSANRIEDQRG